jgi:polygalacturonase
LCKDVSVRGVDIYAHGNNNDGIDIEMSRDVLVEKCRFDQGDDGVVIKSGRNQDAWRLNTPTENVFVRDCEIVNAHTVLGVGSEISGGVRSVLMKDCTAGSVYRVFFLKTNRRRGGVLENIVCDNVKAEKAKASVFEIDTDVLYEWAKFPDYENRTTRINDIRAENISVQTVRDLVKLRGAADIPPERIRWRNLSAGKITGRKLIIENIKDAAEEP